MGFLTGYAEAQRDTSYQASNRTMWAASRTGVITVCRGAACIVIPHPTNAHRPYLFRHPVLGFINALLLCATIGTSVLLSLTPELARLSTVSVPTIVRLTNAERQKAGLPPLGENAALARSAQLKGEHMLRHDYFDHTSPDGVSPWAWFDLAKYSYVYAGENLAIDFSEAEDVVAAWMQSSGHRRNLLADRYTEVGIAVVTGEFEGRTATVVVQHFGQRPPTSVATNPSETPAPSVASESQASPVPVIPAVPELLEPREGQTVSTGTATVRGTSPKGSTVELSIDGVIIETFTSTDGSFRGTFALPENQERTAILRVHSVRNGQRSAWSESRTVRIDTKGPEVSIAHAVLLPDPQGIPGRSLLVVPAESDVRSLEAVLSRQLTIPLERDGAVFAARLKTPLHGSVVLRATDAHQNIETVRWSPLTYTTSGAPAASTRLQLAAVTGDLRLWMVSMLLLFAAMFVMNMIVHVVHRHLLHTHLVAHAVIVLGLGAVVIFFT